MAMALRERHFRAVLDLVGEAHDVNDLDEFREVLLPGLRRMVPAEHASYNEVRGAGEVLAAIIVPDVPAELYPVWARHAGDNPLLARFVRTRDGRAYRFSDVLTRAELRRLPLFRELYEPMGIAHQVAFTLPSPTPLTMGIALSRSPASGDFGEAERAMLDLARPHLIQAYRNAQVRERTAQLLAAAADGLDDDGRGLLMADADGNVAFATRAALELASQALGRPVALGDPLAPPLLGPTTGAGATATHALDDDTLLIRRVRSAALTTILLEPARRVLSVATLEGLGLTAREAEVLVAIARGRSTGEAAADLTISPRTVHKHLQRVHAKLGVTDRSQAIATAWTAAEAARAATPAAA
jgi:DNA-binding CsgD family transcriptional regulator